LSIFQYYSYMIENTELKPQQLFTVSQIAERWQCDGEKVTKIFANVQGVIDLGTRADIRKRKKAYRILRIPAHVLETVERKLAVR
jgi:hypothetical protein